MEYPVITRKNFTSKVLNTNPRLNIDLIEKAVKLADKAHHGQKRASGEQFIIHPLNVAYLVVQLGFDAQVVTAAILHDVVEDSSLTLEQVEEQFGAEITQLVDAVTKIADLPFSAGRSVKKAENYRKFLLAVTRDVRVVFIKLADRLHNMRTLNHLKPAKQRAISRETLDIYIPLANRFGLQDVKRELEDLCLKYLYPDTYKDLHRFVKLKKSSRDAYINEFVKKVKAILLKNDLEAEISGRSKHFWSIFRKKVQRNLDYEEINDYYAIRIITKEIDECFTALGIINSAFHPLENTYKDYITKPKPNGYQSLHQVIISAEGRKIEVQIRTQQMHIYAEEGPAAHWKYKEFAGLDDGSQNRLQLDKKFDDQIIWLRELLTLYQQDKPESFIHSLKERFFKDRIIVKTPDHDFVELPSGATPLDFAFAVHTEIGLHCISAQVNKKHVSLRHQLQDGDEVEVKTARNARPSKDWLDILSTSRARQRVKAWFRQQEREDAVMLGKNIFEKEIRKNDLRITDQKVQEIAKSLKYPGTLDMFAAIGEGNLLIEKVIELLIPDHSQPESSTLPAQDKDFSAESSQSYIEIQGLENLMVHFAKCCNPLPGDEVIGYITRGRGLSIHRKDCANPAFQKLQKNEPHRIMQLQWQKSEEGLIIRLKIIAFPRPKLNYDITTLLAQKKIKTLTSSSHQNGDHEIINLTVEVSSQNTMQKLKSDLLNIKSIEEVTTI